MVQNRLHTLEETIRLIKENRILSIAGHEELLKQLPKGRWVGGSLTHFMDVQGGVVSETMLFINDFTPYLTEFKISDYAEEDVLAITPEAFQNGLSYLIMPLNSPVHQAYGKSTLHMNDLFRNPVIGWIAGYESNLLPIVFNGETGECFDNKIVVLHGLLPKGKIARMEITNPFTMGDGDKIKFLRYGFTQRDCLVNGTIRNFYEYLTENSIDLKLPFMTTMGGALINVHPLQLDEKKKSVKMAAAVFPEYTYRQACRIDNYAEKFKSSIPTDTQNIIASVNCFANYKYLNLKGEKLGNITGPFAFGEVGFILFNQTMVNLYVENA